MVHPPYLINLFTADREWKNEAQIIVVGYLSPPPFISYRSLQTVSGFQIETE